MYDISTVVAILMAVHLTTMYVGTDVLRLEYTHFVMMTFLTSILGSILVKAISPNWRAKADAALKAEEKQGGIGKDLMLTLTILVAGGAVSAALVYRRFGVGGWLGLVAANALMNLIA
jgi:hypothetical protein